MVQTVWYVLFMCSLYYVEVEQNLIVGRIQSESVDNWKICDTLFPSTITKCPLSVAENIKYRLASLNCPCTYILYSEVSP